MEDKLRERLLPGKLPPPCKTSDEAAPTRLVGRSPKGGAIIPDTLPALTFHEGAVVEDVSVYARAKGLELGCRVVAIRKVRNIKAGAEGELVLLGKEALVKWDSGSTVDVVDEVDVQRLIPLASLQAAAPPVPVPKEAKPAAVDLPEGQKWSKLTPAIAMPALKQLILGAMYQIFANRSAGPEHVMLEKETSRILCIADVKPRGLIVLPHVTELGEGLMKQKKRKGPICPEVWVKIADQTLRHCLTAPFNCWTDSTLAPGPEDVEAGESPEAGESSPVPVLELFWKLYETAQNEGGSGGLTLMEAEVVVPASCAQIKDATLRGGCKKATGGVTLWIPYLTNLEELRRGDRLWVKKCVWE